MRVSLRLFSQRSALSTDETTIRNLVLYFTNQPSRFPVHWSQWSIFYSNQYWAHSLSTESDQPRWVCRNIWKHDEWMSGEPPQLSSPSQLQFISTLMESTNDKINSSEKSFFCCSHHFALSIARKCTRKYSTGCISRTWRIATTTDRPRLQSSFYESLQRAKSFWGGRLSVFWPLHLRGGAQHPRLLRAGDRVLVYHEGRLPWNSPENSPREPELPLKGVVSDEEATVIDLVIETAAHHS